MVIRGAFHSTKNSENFRTGANDTEISREKFPEYQKSVEAPRHFPFEWNTPEIPGWVANGNKIFQNFISEFLGVLNLRKIGITGKYCSVRKPEISNQNFFSNGNFPWFVWHSKTTLVSASSLNLTVCDHSEVVWAEKLERFTADCPKSNCFVL